MYGSRLGPRTAFGSRESVVAAAIGRAPDDGLVQAVCAAVERELGWEGMSPRSILDVFAGAGEVVHVTATTNRESIARHGLDWRLMRGRGVAGSRAAELPAVFLCRDREDASFFFVDMARVPVDVWAVRVDGLWVENGPDGWLIVPEPIPPERLRLLERDLGLDRS